MAKTSGHIDWYILLSVVGLMLFSVAFVYSASSSFAAAKFGSSEKLFWNHAIRVLLGLAAIVVFSRIDYHVFEKFTKPILLLALACLVYVLLTGAKVKGAARWIHIGFINFQPSEFVKYALVLHISAMTVAAKDYLNDFRTGLMPLLLWTLVTCGLIAAQPNLSTASVVFFIASVIMFVGNAPLKKLGGIALGGLIVASIYAVSAPYRLKRIMAFTGYGSGTEAEVVNYQLQQAIIAFGSGGIFGVGPGQSLQRDFFLPESYGDFIFSVVGEEYGFIGALFILSAFGMILWRGINVAKNAPDDFGRLLAIGITVTLAIYAFVNAGVNCGVLPTTGLPMPFISYGGTSVLFSAAAVGMLLNISAQAGVYPRK